MRTNELKVLLDEVPDTRELILRRLDRAGAEYAAWRDAHEEAATALLDWSALRDRETYVAYRAAQDREDAAQDILAATLTRPRGRVLRPR
jgi:hypothetical protein